MYLIQKQKYKGGIKANGLLPVSGTKLAEALGIKICTPKIKPKKYILERFINYGCSSIPWFNNDDYESILNKPGAVWKAVDKLLTLQILKEAGIKCPDYTTSLECAGEWFDSPKRVVVFCRKLLSASAGRGIVVARNIGELVRAPLYTLYVPKVAEYRFHVAFNKVIHIQKKLKLTHEEREARGISSFNQLIRNLDNGYVFTSNLTFELEGDGSYSDPKMFMMTEAAIGSIKALGLDFGAVDLIVGKNGKVYVLEVNTAPGIEEPTLSKYVEAFNSHFG